MVVVEQPEKRAILAQLYLKPDVWVQLGAPPVALTPQYRVRVPTKREVVAHRPLLGLRFEPRRKDSLRLGSNPTSRETKPIRK